MEFLHSIDIVYTMPAVAIMVTTVAYSLLERLRRYDMIMQARLRRYDVALLAGLCLVILVYSTGNLSLRAALYDGRQNLEAGIRLAQEGHYRTSDRRQYSEVGVRLAQAEGHYRIHDIIGYGYHDREPLVPFVIAAIDLTRQALGHDPVPLECVDSNTVAPECALTYRPHKFLHTPFLLLAAVSAFFIVLWFTGTKWLAYATLLLTTQSTELLYSADSFYTEVPAAALMVTTSALALLKITRRRPIYSVLLGLALAALVLTKTIFVYLWIIVALVFVVSDLSKKRFDQSSVALVSLFLVAHFIPLGLWMARNYAMSGDFSLVSKRPAVEAWSIRASYNEMREDEFTAGFSYYLPLIRRDIDNRIFQNSYETFVQRRGQYIECERQRYLLR